MRNVLLTLLLGGRLTANLGCPGFQLPAELENIFQRPDRPFDQKCDGPDPRAASIDYQLVSEDVPGISGRVRVSGAIDNFGRTAFTSSSGQQTAQLLMDGTVVDEWDFVNLLLGEQLVLQHELDWDVTREFQPAQFTLRILYDPDIFSDGNPLNDDCNTDNNERSRSAADIDALFE